jgi:hypothetical protein
MPPATSATRGCLRLSCAVAIFALAPVRAQVVPLNTVQDLYAACNGPAVAQQLACLVSVRGIADSTSACAPNARTYAAIKRAFLLWAAAHPEHSKDPATAGLTLAMQERRPCRN